MNGVGEYCRHHGHVWKVIGTFPDDNMPGVTWQLQECRRCGERRWWRASMTDCALAHPDGAHDIGRMELVEADSLCDGYV